MTIPTDVTIPLTDLQRSALKALLDHAPPGLQLDEILGGVFLLGLSRLLEKLPVSDVTLAIEEKTQAPFPVGKKRLVQEPRPEPSYLGFSILPHQMAALEHLEARHPMVEEDELCRIILDVGLKALPYDQMAQLWLDSATWTIPAEGGN